MKKQEKKESAITLVALIVTIIILLILAGISIQTLGQTNLFNQAKQAKNATRNAQKQENKTLSEYMDKMNEYLPETLAYKVNSGEISIGSYIKYTPDTVNDEKINKLIEELGRYSGSEANTKKRLKQEMDLNWRVLDVKDGQVRLISERPTSSLIELNGYNGYNNAVKLLDDACSILYNNKTLVSKIKNIKIEDITRYMTTYPTEDKTEYKPTNINIPNIVRQEINQVVEESVTPKIEPSEQDDFVIGSLQSSTNILRKTYWQRIVKEDTSFFKEKIYYELFIKKGESYYSIYWISSRCILADNSDPVFCVRYVGPGSITAPRLYNASDGENCIAFAFRPVITLNSNVKLDEKNPGDGTENNGYNIK